MYFYLSFLLALALGVHCAPWSTVERESTTPEGVLSLPVRSKDLSEQEIRKKNPASSRAAAPVSSDIIAVSPFSLGHSYEVASMLRTPVSSPCLKSWFRAAPGPMRRLGIVILT